jgi:hypothetical protein
VRARNLIAPFLVQAVRATAEGVSWKSIEIGGRFEDVFLITNGLGIKNTIFKQEKIFLEPGGT